MTGGGFVFRLGLGVSGGGLLACDLGLVRRLSRLRLCRACLSLGRLSLGLGRLGL